jgi:hypothetical protein
MTLDETTRRILASADAQDLAALERAAHERQAAIAKLASLPPTPELREAVARSIQAGEEAQRAIRSIRHRIRKESRRLATIEHGFVRALRPTAKHQFDYQG